MEICGNLRGWSWNRGQPAYLTGMDLEFCVLWIEFDGLCVCEA